MPAFVIYVIAAMLAIGVAPLPYGYYSFLRLAGCSVFAYSSFVSNKRNYKILPWVYGALALLFNPFVKVHLPKELWMIVDVGSAILLLATKKWIEDV